MTPGHGRPRSGRILSGRSLVLLSLFAVSIACLTVMAIADDSSADYPDVSGTLGSVSWEYYESEGLLTLSGTGTIDPPSGSHDANDYREYPFERVVIQNGITGIGYVAFLGCESMTSITIPDSVTSIGSVAFKNCTSLEAIALSDNITSIGGSAFYGCSSLRGISIPDTVTALYLSALSGCTGLERIYLSDSLLSIYDTSVTDLDLYEPDRVTVTDLADLDGIKGATFLKNHGKLVRMAPYGVDGDAEWSLRDGILVISGTGATADYEADTHPIWWEYRDEIRSLAIVGGITRIGDRALSGLDNLEAVYFGPDIAEIGVENFPVVFYAKNGTTVMDSTAAALHGNLFVKSGGKLILTDRQGEVNGNIGWSYNDGALRVFGTGDMDDFATADEQPWSEFRGLVTSITVDSGVTRIGDFAFYMCGNAGSLNIADSVTSIGGDAVSYTTVLHDLALPKGLTSLGDYAFRYSGITSVTIPQGVTAVGHGTFLYCNDLATVIIPDSVTSIGEEAFLGCIAVRELCMSNGLTEVAADAFTDDHLYDSDGTIPITVDAAHLRGAVFIEKGSKAVKLEVDMVTDGAVISKASDTHSIAVSPEDILYAQERVKSNPDTSLQFLLKDGIKAVFDKNVIQSMNLVDSAVTVIPVDKSALDETLRQLVGDYPVYNFTYSGNSLGTGKATVAVPFAIPEGKTAEGLKAYCIKDDAVSVSVPCTFADGKASFDTDQLSMFYIGYDASPAPDEGEKGTNVGLIVGVIIAVIAVAAIGVGAYIYMRKRSE